ncbi:MAG TPA: MarR family transcriptional regulator [Streptosporangiaceae bacterium]|jgi:DNA-binding MarR family transcriptional regulator
MSDTAANQESNVRRLAESLNARLREVVLLLRRVNADQQVTNQQLSVLGSLTSGPRRMTELAAEHGVRLPTMTVLVRRLVRSGLVVRGALRGDARVVTVELTPQGAEQLEAGRERRIAFLAERLSALSVDERAALVAALPVLRKLFT